MTTEETNTLVTLLNKLEPGFLPHDIFIAIARLVVSPAVEFIPLRMVGGKVQVFLTRRPANDPWSNKLHTPGTVLRPTDTSLEDAFTRLLSDEFGISDRQSAKISFVGYSLQVGHERGSGLCLEHILELQEAPTTGEYYDVDSLPDDLIEFQKPMIQRAVAKFLL